MVLGQGVFCRMIVGPRHDMALKGLGCVILQEDTKKDSASIKEIAVRELLEGVQVIGDGKI